MRPPAPPRMEAAAVRNGVHVHRCGRAPRRRRHSRSRPRRRSRSCPRRRNSRQLVAAATEREQTNTRCYSSKRLPARKLADVTGYFAALPRDPSARAPTPAAPHRRRRLRQAVHQPCQTSERRARALRGAPPPAPDHPPRWVPRRSPNRSTPPRFQTHR